MRGSILCEPSGPGVTDAVHQIDQRVVVDAAVAGQTDLAGTTGADAFRADPHRILERTQCMGVELRLAETLVAGEAAAVDALWNHHVRGAAPGNVDQRLRLAQVLGAAGDVHRHWRVLWGDGQAIEPLLTDELELVVDIQAAISQVLYQA